MHRLSEILVLLVVFCSLCLMDSSKGESLSDVYVKECFGTNMKLSYTDMNIEKRYNNLESRYINCTRVKGNLEIVHFQSTDDQFDFSFLENIREVDGYVLIVGNFVKRMRLTKLRVIRGLDRYDDGESEYSLYVAHNSRANDNSTGLEELQLPSLVEILAGKVLFQGNSRLCFGERTVNWRHILNNNVEKSVTFLETPGYDKINCTSFATCHENCSSANGQRHCWGRGADMCQSVHICACPGNDQRCSKDKTCCNRQCLAGCNGNGQNDCLSCRNFARGSSECIVSCSSQIYRHRTGDNGGYETPSDKYAFGSKCVDKCEAGFVVQDDRCVQHCRDGYMVNEGEKMCVPCNGTCPQTCKGHETLWLHKDELPSYTGCKKVVGSLKISNQTFVGHITHDNSMIYVEDLERLSSIEEITGGLDIQAKLPEFTSLRFLRNLRVIGGVGLADDEYGLSIGGTSLKSLELNSLQRVGKGVVIWNNADLCYAEGINWTTVTDGMIYAKGNKNSSICDGCSTMCSTSNGCMGPDNDSCITCNDFQLTDRSCSSNCSTEFGFYVKDGIRGNRECRPCHEECKGSCTGDGPEHCFECRNARLQGACVAQCPSQMYPDDNATCHWCNSVCNNCTGNSTVLGESGCNDCQHKKIRYDDPTSGHCIANENECNANYFTKDDVIRISAGKTGSSITMKVCRKCHPECNRCNGTGSSDCFECRNYRQNDANGISKCVDKCSQDFYDAGNGQCKPCHSECLGCTGNETHECVTCRYVRIYPKLPPELSEKDVVNDTKYKSYCAMKCPKGEEEETRQNGTESICVAFESQANVLRPAISIPVFVVLFLVIVAVGVVIFVVLWRKQKLKQLREKILAPDEIPMVSPGKAKPDMALLRLIKESELRRGNVIGSGAFGTVYKGFWIPDKENVKIPVAIKVLQETSNTNQNVELLDEARIMATVRHPCCVRILAVCMTAQMMLITQLMPLGCLLDYVRKEKSNIGSRALLLWSVQIAKGMKYLEELGIVHRDLAARNVLVHSPNQVKITDFGLAKLREGDEEEIHSEGGKMPIKWLALECIQHRIYTHKSDVWSYGVTLWEMFSYGSRPYESLNAREIPNALEKGERLPQPNICTIDVYMIMLKCWMLDSDSRPTFAELVFEFTRMAADPARYLVITGDTLMRLPSQAPDAKDFVRLMSLPFDELDLEVVSGEEYLRPMELVSDDNDVFSPSHIGRLISIPEDALCENFDALEKRMAEAGDDSDGNLCRKLSEVSRDGSQRYTSSPCRNDDGSECKENEKPKSNGPKFQVDENDYLDPKSAMAEPSYLDLVYQAPNEDSKHRPTVNHYVDMNTKVGVSRDNQEYFNDKAALLIDDDVFTPNDVNSNIDFDKTKTKESEYYNVTSNSADETTVDRRFPGIDIRL